MSGTCQWLLWNVRRDSVWCKCDLTHVCDMTLSYMWRDIFICVTLCDVRRKVSLYTVIPLRVCVCEVSWDTRENSSYKGSRTSRDSCCKGNLSVKRWQVARKIKVTGFQSEDQFLPFEMSVHAPTPLLVNNPPLPLHRLITLVRRRPQGRTRLWLWSGEYVFLERKLVRHTRHEPEKERFFKRDTPGRWWSPAGSNWRTYREKERFVKRDTLGWVALAGSSWWTCREKERFIKRNTLGWAAAHQSVVGTSWQHPTLIEVDRILNVGCAHLEFAPYLARIHCQKSVSCIRQNGAHWCPKRPLRGSVSEMTLACIRFQSH